MAYSTRAQEKHPSSSPSTPSQSSQHKEDPAVTGSSSSSSSSDDDGEETKGDETKRCGTQKRMQSFATLGTGRRGTVTAPPLIINAEWCPPIIEKSDVEAATITQELRQHMLFHTLTDTSVRMIVAAMTEVHFQPRERLMTQGDDGDCLYLITRGSVTCTVDDTVVLTLEMPDTRHAPLEASRPKRDCNLPSPFLGELALLYDTPRAATVTATSDTWCWALDQRTFKQICCNAESKKRLKVVEFLSHVPLLSKLSHLDTFKLADALVPCQYTQDAVILTQAEVGSVFYLIETGTVDVLVDGFQVAVLTSGDYFGERALLTSEVRDATLIATSDTVTCLVCDRETFTRLLGPLTFDAKE